MKTETNKMSAGELKEQGNRLYGARKYDEAIQCYSKAIVSSMFSAMNHQCNCMSIILRYYSCTN